MQDVGGEDRPLPAALLPLLSYLAPNQPELQALTGMPTDTQEQVRMAAAAAAAAAGMVDSCSSISSSLMEVALSVEEGRACQRGAHCCA
mgnify:CR=1 FL=1